MSLDATLDNLNGTLHQVEELLRTIQYSVFIIAIALAICLVGSTAVYYYSKYKKYHQLSEESSPNTSAYSHNGSSYKKGNYDPVVV